VRFVADDGRKLIADRELKIEPPGGGADGGWVPVTQSTAAAERLAPPEVGPQIVPSGIARSAEPKMLPVPEPERIQGTPTLAPPEPSAAAPVASSTVAAPIAPAMPTNPAPVANVPTGVDRSDSRVAQVTKEEPRAPAAKKRPTWSPYRK